MSWRDKAACLGHDPDIFFPVTNEHRVVKRATDICGGCPVRIECLTEALEIRAPIGIWGGLTPSEREPLRRWRYRDCHPAARGTRGRPSDPSARSGRPRVSAGREAS